MSILFLPPLCLPSSRHLTCLLLSPAHPPGLRQSPHTLKSTGFDVHQDTEDFPFIEYTVVVKLTGDGKTSYDPTRHPAYREAFIGSEEVAKRLRRRYSCRPGDQG